MKLFFPLQLDRFRLTTPLDIGLGRVLPVGTVFRMEQVRTNKTAKYEDTIYFVVMACPEPQYAMKKYGGTADWGTRFGLTHMKARELEVEIVEGMK